MGKRTIYWERDPSCPRTIILLHGFRGDHNGLLDLAKHLEGYRLILPDLPGYGYSKPLDVPHTLINFAAWLDEFVRMLDPADLFVWGHSYSGSIALIQGAVGIHKPAAIICASLAAVRRDPSAWIATSYYQLGRLMAEPWRKRWLTSRMIDRVTGRFLFQTVSQTQQRAFMRRGERVLSTLNPRVITEQYLSALDTRLETYASMIEVPVLIAAGAKDKIVPISRLKKLARIMPQAQLYMMPDQGHLAPIERPAGMAAITKHFIEQQSFDAH